jgi:hypothetical protein
LLIGILKFVFALPEDSSETSPRSIGELRPLTLPGRPSPLLKFTKHAIDPVGKSLGDFVPLVGCLDNNAAPGGGLSLPATADAARGLCFHMCVAADRVQYPFCHGLKKAKKEDAPRLVIVLVAALREVVP